jgi:hypothetical protein
MLIEHPEALKTFLAEELGKICDNSEDLAKYVISLVRKNMPLDSLRAHCADQLQVFLNEETGPFLDRLFNFLGTNDELSAPQAPTSPPPQPERSQQATKSTFFSKQEHGRDYSRREYRRDVIDDEDRDFRRRGRSSPESVSIIL